MAGAGVACSASRPARCGDECRHGCAGARAQFEPTIWFAIDRDGIVTVNIIRAEMGQHVGTALARILADELEADWDKVRIVHVDTDPKWGLMVTGGSWSVWQTFPVFSQRRRGRTHRAGRGGRQAYRRSGAQCRRATARSSRRDRSISYGEIVAARRSPPQLHAPTNWRRCRSSPPPSAGSSGAPRGARHSRQDQRHRALRHRRHGRRHGLCAAEDSADAQRLEGTFDRRLRRKESEGLYEQSRARRSIRHGAGMGDGVRRALIRPRSARPIWSRSTGRRARGQTSPRRMCWTTAPCRSPTRAAASSWLTTTGLDAAFRGASRRSSRPIRRAACCTSSSSRSMRWPSRRTASSRSIPAISGRA